MPAYNNMRPRYDEGGGGRGGGVKDTYISHRRNFSLTSTVYLCVRLSFGHCLVFLAAKQPHLLSVSYTSDSNFCQVLLQNPNVFYLYSADYVEMACIYTSFVL